jgi:hypothetical protein
VCVELTNDPLYCGSCTNSCVAMAGDAGAGALSCKGGSCMANCPGATSCGGACVQTNSDERNCGRCGVKCTGNDKCVTGECKCPESNTIKTCGGRCVNTQQDRAHCGVCYRACAGFEVCSGGNCVGVSPVDGGNPG